MPPVTPGPAAPSRRRLLGVATLAVGWWAAGGIRSAGALTPFERLHTPVLRLPVVTTNGAKVPITVELEPSHGAGPSHHHVSGS